MLIVKQGNVTVIFDRRRTVEDKGVGRVEIRVYLSRTERRYLSICDATPASWKRVSKSKAIVDKCKECEKILNAMDVLGEEMTIANFDLHMNQLTAKTEAETITKANVYNGVDQDQSFIDYMQKSVDAEDLAIGTRKHKQVVIDSLKTYGKMTRFCDLTAEKLIRYDNWLHDGQRTDVTIKGYHKKIHKYVSKLRALNQIPVDPYSQVKIKSGKSKEREPLTESELLKLRQAVMVDEKMERVRDLFVFSAYTGLAYVDVMEFDFKKMTSKEGDLYYIDGSRMKTGTKFFTPILKPAMEVLQKYDFHLPHISNQKANDYLRLIKSQLGIVKPMTFHVARHSFATLALAHDVPMKMWRACWDIPTSAPHRSTPRCCSRPSSGTPRPCSAPSFS